MTFRYEGGLRCVAQHGPSGSTLSTDAPRDNLGLGESFSPTDLVATALGTCIATTMAIVAKRKGYDLPGITADVEKHMSDDAPRRIAKVVCRLRVPLPPDHPDRAVLEAAAHGCPVHRSLHPDVVKEIFIEWVGTAGG